MTFIADSGPLSPGAQPPARWGGGANPFLEAALQYAAAGIAVFPLQPAGKMPLLPSAHPGDALARKACQPPTCGRVGHGLWDATTDPAVIAAWWGNEPNANVGVATGLSNLLVIDIDTKDGKVGAQTLADLEEEHGALPPTYTVRTWSGGLHYFFQMPAERLSNTAGTAKAGLGPDIDTRGDGGYVVAAPSVVRENGKEGVYSVLQATAPATAPEWISEKLTKPKRPMVRPGLPSQPRPAAVEYVDTSTGVIRSSDDLPPRLLAWAKSRIKKVADLPEGGPATQPVNDVALELGHRAHLLGEDWVRTQLRAAIDGNWTDGHEKGYAAIDTGLRDGVREPYEWREYEDAPFGDGQAGQPPPGTRGGQSRRGRAEEVEESDLLPPPFVPDEVVEVLLINWQEPEDGKDVLTLRRWRGDWMRWRGTHWRTQGAEAVRAELYPMLKGKWFLANNGKPEKWGANRNKIADLIEVMSAVTYLDQDTAPGTWIEGSGPSGIIACRNGLLEVRNRTLHPHSARFFNASSLPFDYDPEAPEPTEWLKFLDSVWGDDKQAIQTFHEWIAYVLSGRTDLHKMLLVIGPKRSGKGTLARVMTALVGAENVGGPSMGDFAKNFGMSDLVDKPLAIVGDARMPSTGEREIVERLLTISAADSIRADRKNREAWVGRLPTRIVIMSNELPSFADSSGAIASRFILLQMTKSFIGKEDTDLERRLMTELPGILNLVLDAMESLEKRGRITEPESSDTAREIFSEQTAPIEVFLKECCKEQPDPEAKVPVAHLFKAWEEWCDATNRGAYKGTKEGFAKKLLSARPGVRRVRPRDDQGRQTPHYQGIELLSLEERSAKSETGYFVSESGVSRVPTLPYPQVGRVETGETGWSDSASSRGEWERGW